MQTRRDFIKGIAALVATTPIVGLPAINEGLYAQHIQPVNISADLNREPVLELGRKKPYYDLYLSPEALEDIRNWVVDQVDEQTRREIYISDGPTQLFGISINGNTAS
jgi:hypothetical protein